ncbi:GNAT family N-acetyltransferase [Coprobacter secundus]|uniref:Acetyltransferase n=1 Tax=Coprobacter secundus subsp. similis TaxID=2751153 RepID=A0A7G1I1Q2_9BACT|nr:GNAT family N-acetyltransferase [Coprobacter secundus]BCI64521.1 acetyltransferase [Coprobacter secundus subsp. similis]CCY39169.1 putative uncharacterized protein [Tannerella sp. CAG:118]
MNKIKEKVRDLWQNCFDDSEDFMNLYFSTKYSDENTLVKVEGDLVLSALQMLPYTMTCWGSEVRTSYISGASTRLEYRGRGLMKTLLSEAFQVMRDRKIPLSILIPAEDWLYEYYQRMGYVSVFRRIEDIYTDLPAFLPVYKEHTVDELFTYFSAHMRKRACCVQHSFDDFGVILEDFRLAGGKVVSISGLNSDIRGMAFVVPSPEQVIVKEWFYDDEETKLELLCTVRGIFPNMEIHCFSPVTKDSRVSYVMGMLRIIDVYSLLSFYASSHPKASFRYLIKDAFVSGNNGLFTVNNGICVHQPALLSYNSVKEINVFDLAKLLFGQSGEINSELTPYMSLMLE